MESLISGIDATEASLSGATELSSMISAFVLVAVMSAAGFSAVWLVTTALIAASP